jgi:hypothetical protein
MNRTALVPVVVLALALTLPIAAHADDASHRAKAQEMVALLHTDQPVQQVSGNMKKQVADAADHVTGPNPQPAVKTKLDDFKKQTSDLIEAKVSWKVLEPQFVDIYYKTFTEPEMDGILAFYKTPSGKVLIDKTPTINAQASQLEQTTFVALETQLKQMFDDYRRTLGTTPPPANAAPATPGSSSPSPSTPPPATSAPK